MAVDAGRRIAASQRESIAIPAAVASAAQQPSRSSSFGATGMYPLETCRGESHMLKHGTQRPEMGENASAADSGSAADDRYFAERTAYSYRVAAMKIAVNLPESREAALVILRLAGELFDWREASQPQASKPS